MAKKVILGSDFGRDAFKAKVNDNFTELYDKDVALEEQINSLDANKMPLPTNIAGSVGEFKKIQGLDSASLSLPSGGTWEYQAYWIQTSTGYAAFIGGGAGGIAAGGTQILSAQAGYTPVAFVRRFI